MAFTKTFALIASIIIALTIIPPGALILFAGRVIHAIRYPMADVLFNGSIAIPGVLAPGLIVIGLIVIATGNEWGQTT